MKSQQVMFLGLLVMGLALYTDSLHSVSKANEEIHSLKQKLEAQEKELAVKEELLRNSEARTYVIRRATALAESGFYGETEAKRTLMTVLHLSLTLGSSLTDMRNQLALVASGLRAGGHSDQADREVREWNSKFPESSIPSP
jgi:hypothetical protein